MVKRRWWVVIALLLVFIGGLYLEHRINTTAAPTAEGFLKSPLKDLAGAQQPFKQWKGRILVVNFWASWCVPCQKEIPGFIALQREFAGSNIQFVGIALDDKAPVQKFVISHHINYPILMGDLESFAFVRAMGDRSGGLPFTAVIDASGHLLAVHTGDYAIDPLRNMLNGLRTTKSG